MRRAVLLTAAAVLLAGPTALAFFSGAYFEGPRLVATLVAWALVLAVAVAAPRPLPGSFYGRAALAGLVLIAAWTGVSLAWAPLSGPASNSLVRLLLYIGAFIVGAAALRERLVSEAVEPVLAFGALIVIEYGLAGRLLPGIVHLSQSVSAHGRLEQPLTYWNAEGALAALGLVLSARLAGTPSRPVALRALAAAACAPLGLGVYLSFSRGAIAAALVALALLLSAAPTFPQLRSVAIALAVALSAAGVAAGLPAVNSLEGSVARREQEGLVMLGVLATLMIVAAVVQGRVGAAERQGRLAVGELGMTRPLRAGAALAVVAGLAVLVAGGLSERGRSDEQRRGPVRLTSVESRRYDYWRVAMREIARHPLRGVGAGGFRVLWLRERPVRDSTLEVHSLPLEMALELGLPGVIGLGLLIGGIAAAARRSLRAGLLLAPGAIAAVTAWLLHASIDWDWQMPAVTLPALVLAGALVAGVEGLAPVAGGRPARPLEAAVGGRSG
jgi:hypothetical protein